MKIELNPDKEFVKEMRKKIKEANGHCPCVLPEMRNADTKCMCADFRKMIDERRPGFCHCSLYYIVEQGGQE